MLAARFVPVIAFNLINYAAGLTAISWWTFIWTTGLGILPLTVLMVTMGDQMHYLTSGEWALFAGFAVGFWRIRMESRWPRTRPRKWGQVPAIGRIFPLRGLKKD